jgi:hypothetical protein
MTATLRQATALLALVLQNASVTLVTHKSRSGKPAHELYLPSTAVVSAEVCKFVVSLAVDVRQRCNESKSDTQSTGRLFAQISAALRDTFRPRELCLLAIPSLLYVVQNNALVRLYCPK